MLVLTAPIEYVPSTVLGAVIVLAALNLIEPGRWRTLTHRGRAEVVTANITTVFVVSFGVMQGDRGAVVL